MKKIAVLIFYMYYSIHSFAQIEPINFIEEVNYGFLSGIYDHLVIDDHFIVIGTMSNGENFFTPTVTKLDNHGNSLWSTLDQYSESIEGSISGNLKLILTKKNELFALIRNDIWKIDISTGEILSQYEFFGDYKSIDKFLDYDDNQLLATYKKDINGAPDITEMALIHKTDNDTVKTINLGAYTSHTEVGIDDVKNIYIGINDTITKYNGNNLEQTIWSIPLENTEEISRIHFDDKGDLFVFTKSPNDGGHIHSINRHTGEINWTTFASVGGTGVRIRVFVEDQEHLYMTYRHIYVGSVQADFQATKIKKEDGSIVWKNTYKLDVEELEENPNGNNAAAINIALDCDRNLYLTGYHGDSNYGPAMCGVVKVNADDGSKAWDKTITILPEVHDVSSYGIRLSVINDTLVVMAKLQTEENGRSRAHISGLSLESGEIHYTNEIDIESCEYSSFNDLQLIEDGFVDASITGKTVSSSIYRSFDITEKVAINNYNKQYAGQVYYNSFGHFLTSYSRNESTETTMIYSNALLNPNILRKDTIVLPTLNSKPVELYGGIGYKALLYGVENTVRMSFLKYSTNSVIDTIMDIDGFDINDQPKRNCLFSPSSSELCYIGKDKLDIYSINDFSLSRSYSYSSTLHAYSHVIVNDSIICIAGRSDNQKISLLLMDYTNGNTIWQVETQDLGKAYQLNYDGVNGIYLTGTAENNMYAAKFALENGQIEWQFDNDQLAFQTIPMDAAIIADRNTLAIACKQYKDVEYSDGILIILSLQGNIIHVEKFEDELKAESSVNTIFGASNNKYYLGGSHNTLNEGKRGFVYSADFSAIDDQAGITGQVFFDENQNGLRDDDEQGLPNIRIKVDPLSGYTLTNNDGHYFKLAAENEVYTVTPEIDTSIFELTTDSTSYTLTYMNSSSSISNNDFGYTADLEANVKANLTSDPTRCNSEARFYLNVRNEGYLLESGVITLTYDTNVEYLSAFNEPDEHLEDSYTLKWAYNSLLPFEEIYFPIQFNMPDELSTGLEMEFVLKVESDQVNTILDQYTYSPTVLCSYDPNDKLVTSSGIQSGNYTTFGDSILTYTVRFQNTGNAPAINVAIRDTIDENFDMQTFNVVNSSHSLQTNINGQYVEFVFKDIYLADSISNEQESHGQVTYEIMLKETIQDNTTVENSASIYFDFNPPIKTNTTKNTMVKQLPTSIEDNRIHSYYLLHPNPTRNEIFLMNNSNQEIDEIRIFDASGKQVMTTNKKRILTENLNSGYYIMQVRSGSNLSMLHFVKI